jgi:imidazolonepropionase-like amidohydrolase
LTSEANRLSECFAYTQAQPRECAGRHSIARLTPLWLPISRGKCYVEMNGPMWIVELTMKDPLSRVSGKSFVFGNSSAMGPVLRENPQACTRILIVITKDPMRTRIVLFALCLIAFPGPALPQSPSETQTPASIFVKAGKVLDVRKGGYIENAGIWIEGEKIKEVGRASDIQPHVPKNTRVIELGRATVLPGLIDCHTHVMAREPGGPDGYTLMLATKSQAFRALEGAYDARITLQAGFTTIRDVESEGSGYADVALRDAVEQGLAEGPRMQVATRAIAAVGQYNPFGISPDLVNFPTGAQMISGQEEARRAVREQIGHGADLVKVYADWQYPTLTVDEIRVVVEEAHKLGRKVAAHATTPEGIKNAVIAGVDSVEHGHRADQQDLELMKAKGTFLVPTVGGIDASAEKFKNEPDPERRRRIEAYLGELQQSIQQSIQQAMSLGVKIASGYDASSPERQGKNADELVALTKRGMPTLEVIRAATMNAAELMSWQDRVGVLEPGKYADLIAVEGDPLGDIVILQQVKFVMKGGSIVKDTLPH